MAVARATRMPGDAPAAPAAVSKPGPAPAATPAAAPVQAPESEVRALTKQISELQAIVARLARGEKISPADLGRAAVRAPAVVVQMRKARNLELNPMAPLPVPEPVRDAATNAITGYENAPTYAEAMVAINAGRLVPPVFTRDRGFIVE